MNLKIGKQYKFIIKINNAILTYSCKVVDTDDIFVSFIDKYDKEYNYRKDLIIQYEEVNK